MILWFVGTAWAAVWMVFGDPRFNFRMLAVGALLPDLVDVVTGGTWVMHSVTASVTVLAVVMATTRRRSPVRPVLLALPIGMFMHLVFDGAFTRTEAFWWPFSGVAFGADRLPSIDRGWWNVPLEVAGLVLCVWVRRRITESQLSGMQSPVAGPTC